MGLTSAIRWLATLLTIVIALLFGMSAFYRVLVASAARQLEVAGGQIEYRTHPQEHRADANPFAAEHDSTGVRIRRHNGLGISAVLFDHHIYPTWWYVRIPLWAPLLVFGTLAASLWWRRRRAVHPRNGGSPRF